MNKSKNVTFRTPKELINTIDFDLNRYEDLGNPRIYLVKDTFAWLFNLRFLQEHRSAG